MTNFLFWNVRSKPQAKLLRTLCDEHGVDVLAVAECGNRPEDLLPVLNSEQSREYHLVESIAERVRIFTRLPRTAVEPISDDEEIFIRRVKPPIGLEAILVAVHFPSKLHLSSDEQMIETVRLADQIRRAEEKVGHHRTILIGDLNMNPFEPGMVAAEGLHAVMDRKIAKMVERQVQKRRRMFFYNPMWRFFGDGATGPQGTYYYPIGSICYFWNLFDQVLVRPELVDLFVDQSLKIVRQVGDVSLLRNNGRIDQNVSDHLPIVVTVDLERAL